MSESIPIALLQELMMRWRITADAWSRDDQDMRALACDKIGCVEDLEGVIGDYLADKAKEQVAAVLEQARREREQELRRMALSQMGLL